MDKPMGSKKKRRKKPDIQPVLIAIILSALAMGISAFAILQLKKEMPGIASFIPKKPGQPVRDENIQPVKKPPRLVIILDDAGHNTHQLGPFLELPFPLTVAVLPELPWSKSVAEMARAAGKEVILHQPMEAIGGLDPGPGAITGNMTESEIRQIIRSNLYSIPGAVGMNNHMGSLGSADERIMALVLDEARRAGIYYVDSLTIGNSVAQALASSMDLRVWERTVFLDNLPDRASIAHYITEGSKIAEKRGYAIMIGHVWSSELAQTLADLYPQLVEQGFSMSTISKIMMEDDDEDFGY